MLKIGEKCPSGAVVKTILGQSARAAVYTTDDGQLRWNFSENNGVVPEDFSPSISKFDGLMSEIKTIAPEKHKSECFILLGKSLFAALSSQAGKSSIECFADFEKYLHRLAQQRTRTQYVFECMLITAIFCAVTIFAIHGVTILHKEYFYGSVFGAIGGCISVMQRANNVDIDWTLSNSGLLLQAVVRIALGLLFGAIFVLACKSDFLLGAFKTNTGALYLLALVAGFSERMIPDLFGRLEIAGNKKA